MGKTVTRKISSTHGQHADGADVYVTRAVVLRRPIAETLEHATQARTSVCFAPGSASDVAQRTRSQPSR